MRVRMGFLVLVAVLLAAACGGGAEVVAEAEPGAAIPAEALAGRIQAGTAPLVLDVRSREEYAKGHIPGAVNIPHDELPGRLGELPAERDEEIVVHCQSGRRAEMAETTLREGGFSNVRDLTGHWQGWQAADLPAE